MISFRPLSAARGLEEPLGANGHSPAWQPLTRVFARRHGGDFCSSGHLDWVRDSARPAFWVPGPLVKCALLLLNKEAGFKCPTAGGD